MKFKSKVKIGLVAFLVIVAVASYIINKYFKRDIVNERADVSSPGQESVDQYNERKREEPLRKESEKKKKLNNKAQQVNPNYRKELTIDGRVPAVGEIIDPINIWSNYETPTYAGKVRHGEKVTLVKREGGRSTNRDKIWIKRMGNIFFY